MNKELVEHLAKARFLSKRTAGISSFRSDGSECSIENDIEATGAEFFASQQYKRPFNTGIGSFGDGGSDFALSLSTEVVWLGVSKRDGVPRDSGHLIVNPHEPQRWADIYIVIAGTIDLGFTEVGWATHKQLLKHPQQDFGFGMRYAMHTKELNRPEALKSLLKDL